MTETHCYSCGALVNDVDGPVHGYMGSSPGCWAAFGEVSAREYSDPTYAGNHRLTVDAYAIQHPGKPSPQSIQSVAIHLVSLYLVLERETTMQQATRLLQQLAGHKTMFFWLDPPEDLGAITVRNVLDAPNAEMHLCNVHQWATSAWHAWTQWHEQVHEWAKLVARQTHA